MVKYPQRVATCCWVAFVIIFFIIPRLYQSYEGQPTGDLGQTNLQQYYGFQQNGLQQHYSLPQGSLKQDYGLDKLRFKRDYELQQNENAHEDDSEKDNLPKEGLHNYNLPNDCSQKDCSQHSSLQNDNLQQINKQEYTNGSTNFVQSDTPIIHMNETKPSLSNKRIVVGLIGTYSTSDTYTRRRVKALNTDKSFATKQLLNHWSQKNLINKSLAQQYKQRLPNAIVIGCKKCGTTFFRKLMQRHSRIAMAYVEMRYFDLHIRNKDTLWYRQQMQFSFKDQVTMEKSPGYFIHPESPGLIHHWLPDVKLILLVRNPACRVVADYHHTARAGRLNMSLEELMTDPEYSQQKRLIMTQSLYDVHMQRWMKHFPADRLMIIRNEDMTTPKLIDVVHQVQGYLGIDQELERNIHVVQNKVFIENFLGLKFMIFQMEKTGECKYEKRFPEIMADLRQTLKPHVERFEKMVNRTFNWF